jgi:hypothetical protein
MSQPRGAPKRARRGAPTRCPTCDRPFKTGRVCWRCCDQPCRVCGRATGSAFIDICWCCWFRTSAAAPSDERQPARTCGPT